MTRSRSLAVVRAGFVLLCAALGWFSHPFSLSSAGGFLCGALLGGLAVGLEYAVRSVSLPELIGASVSGLIAGLIAALIVAGLSASHLIAGQTLQFTQIGLPLAGIYLGLTVGASKARLPKLPEVLGGSNPRLCAAADKLLDTSVLIDGRISDIAESGFLEGNLIIPEFVLHELQLIADSSDGARRTRGRRGLDVVSRLQEGKRITVEVSSLDFPAIREVDLKLIEFGKQRGAKLVTNDFNLNKLAQVQGVSVLNINELASALRPIVLPGETMRVFVSKEGKEYNQGVAYLEDGTMVVVDNARRQISRTVDIVVTSVLQTTAGKMIFGRFDERASGASAAS